jgi:hypothetical protein
MEREMKAQYKNYSIEAKGYVTDWKWNLLPAIELSWDNVFFCAQFSFLCFNCFIDFTNETKLSEWSARFDQESKQAYEDAESEEKAD